MREKYITNLVGNLKRKRPLRRTGYRWKGSINIDIKEIRWESVEWINLAKDTDLWRGLVKTVINLVPSNSGNSLNS
jgi:hypothetical protein